MLHDGTRCSICAELFTAADLITEMVGTSMDEATQKYVMVKYHPLCKAVEEFH